MKRAWIALALAGQVVTAVAAKPLSPALRAEIESRFRLVTLPIETPFPEEGTQISSSLWDELDLDFDSDAHTFDALLAVGRFDLNAQFQLLFLAVRGYRGLGVGRYDYDYLYVVDRRTHEIIAGLALGSYEELPIWLENYDDAVETRSTVGRLGPDGSIARSTIHVTLGFVLEEEASGSWETVSERTVATERWVIDRRGQIERR